MKAPAAVVWLRRDLRLTDNRLFAHAAAEAERIVPLFVIDERIWHRPGQNRTRFLVDCLTELQGLAENGLVIRTGRPEIVVPEVVRESGAALVVRAGDVSPFAQQRDHLVDRALLDLDVKTVVADWPWAIKPGSLFTKSGTPFKVFTPYFRAWLEAVETSQPDGPSGQNLNARFNHGLSSDPVPPLPRAQTLSAQLPVGGETEAHRRLATFLDTDLAGYDTARDLPAPDRTSRLSPYLKFGCLHPRQLLRHLDLGNDAHRTFASELAWRDFYANVVHHWPRSAWADWKDDLVNIKLDSGPEAERRFEAWCQGETGYPLVDAGMRQLLAEGWMHNRVRMLTASFLVKDLHLHWSRGARHFMEHLVDGDLSSNNHGWQWAAGTGTDAAPYFRIFNPTRQSERFDRSGDYIRRYIPELAAVTGKAIHQPWTLADGPPGGYPAPIVDHGRERQEALDRYQAVRS